MAMMIVKTQMEASGPLVASLLQQHAAATLEAIFPYPATTLITLNPEVLAAVGGVAGMPSLVMATGKGSPLGVVAIYKTDGDITVAYAAESQVIGVWTPDSAEPSEVAQ